MPYFYSFVFAGALDKKKEEKRNLFFFGSLHARGGGTKEYLCKETKLQTSAGN